MVETVVPTAHHVSQPKCSTIPSEYDLERAEFFPDVSGQKTRDRKHMFSRPVHLSKKSCWLRHKHLISKRKTFKSSQHVESFPTRFQAEFPLSESEGENENEDSWSVDSWFNPHTFYYNELDECC